MKNQRFKKFYGKVENEKGVALVVVLMVFIVTAILSVSAVSMVFSDNMFSFHQEYTKKAQYVARSAVATVEKTIMDRMDTLKALEDAMVAANTAYANATTQEERDAKDIVRQQAITEYNNYKNNEIYNKVLPVSLALTHNVLINSDMDTDNDDNTFEVEVSLLGASDSGKFKLASEAFVNGKKGVAVRVLNINKVQKIETKFKQAFSFNDALYADDIITVDANQAFKNQVTGTISYGSLPAPNLTINGVPCTADTCPPRVSSPVLPPALDAFELITDGMSVDLSTPRNSSDLYTENKKNKSYDITPASSGRYTNVTLNAGSSYTFNVTTTATESVVLYLDATLITSNNIVFNVSGGGDLIIYMENLDSTSQGNNIEFIGANQTPTTQKSDIYLFVENVNSDNKNNFAGENLYIYAPDSAINLNNNGINNGSIMADTIRMKNNGTFSYMKPKHQFAFGEDYNSTPASITYDVLNLDNSHWSK